MMQSSTLIRKLLSQETKLEVLEFYYYDMTGIQDFLIYFPHANFFNVLSAYKQYQMRFTLAHFADLRK